MGIVKSAEIDRITIPPNGRVTIKGYLDRKIPFHTVVAMPKATEKSSIPTDLDVTHSLHLYSYNDIGDIPIEISNVTKRTVSVSLRDILCELQPVTVVGQIVLPECVTRSDIDSVLSKVTISTDVKTEENQRCRNLIKEYLDIFPRVPSTSEQLTKSDSR